MIALLLACAAIATGPRDVFAISDTGRGRLVLVDALDGSYLGQLCVKALVPDACTDCVVFGATAFESDDVVEILYGQRDGGGGAVRARVGTAPPAIDWRVDGLEFLSDPERCASEGDASCALDMPHAQVMLPDGAVVVADTLNDRVVWLEPRPVTDATAVTRVLDEVAGAHWPNALQVIAWEDGRTFLLTTWKGSDDGDALGRVMLWDTSSADRFELVWSYPSGGRLAAVHGASLVEIAGEWTLVYAHARGASSSASDGVDGSVGFAHLDAIDEAPRYLGDGVAEDLGFVREAEVKGDQILVTDSGCENLSGNCTRAARVLLAALEVPATAGRSGAWTSGHEEQSFFSLQVEDEVGADLDLSFPFETDLVRFTPTPTEMVGLASCGP